MSTWTASLLCLWSVYCAAMFAQVAHLRSIDDGVGAQACSRMAKGLLAVSSALLLFAKIV